MKYFWFAFSLFIFVLAATPCCADEQQTESVPLSLSMEDHHDSDSHAHDVCSPFCTCTGCGVHACKSDPFQTVDLAFAIPVFSEDKVLSYHFEFASDFEANIWQPPQLG